MKRRFLAGAFALILVVLAGCSGAKPAATTPATPTTPAAPAGPKVEKLVLGFVPSQDAAKINDKVAPMAAYLTKELGVPVTAFTGTNFAGVVEAMGSNQVDIGFLNAFSYVVAHDKYQVISILKSMRNGNSQYRAQLNARKADNIPVCDPKADAKCTKTFEALKGKRLAFVEPGSTSGYLFPAYWMSTLGIDSTEGKYFAKVINAGGHDTSVKAVYNGDVDAAWSFEDARTTLQKDHPDVMDKLVPVAWTDWIPNDGVSIRKDLAGEWQKKITDALMKYATTDEGKKVLKDLYTIDGFAPGADKDYDIVKQTAQKMGVDLNKELQKAK